MNSALAARILEARLRVVWPTSELSTALVCSSRPLHSGAAGHAAVEDAYQHLLKCPVQHCF